MASSPASASSSSSSSPRDAPLVASLCLRPQSPCRQLDARPAREEAAPRLATPAPTAAQGEDHDERAPTRISSTSCSPSLARRCRGGFRDLRAPRAATSAPRATAASHDVVRRVRARGEPRRPGGAWQARARRGTSPGSTLEDLVLLFTPSCSWRSSREPTRRLCRARFLRNVRASLSALSRLPVVRDVDALEQAIASMPPSRVLQ